MEDSVRVSIFTVIASVLLAFPLFADSNSKNGKIRIGILTLESYGEAGGIAAKAEQELLNRIGEVGFYEVHSQSGLEKVLEEIKVDLPDHCRDPKCVIEVGTETGMDRMLFGYIDADDGTYAIQLTLIDVAMKRKIDAVSIEGASGVTIDDLIKNAVARLHGNVVKDTSVSIYHGPKVHNEKEFLYSSAGVLGIGLIYGLINYFAENSDAHNLYAEYHDDDLAGISSLADQIPLFARPAALANAYVAASDDAYGVFYNPAGMAWVGGPEAVLAYQYRFGIDNLAATYVNKATREIGFGQGLLYSSDKDHMLTELYFVTSIAYKFTRLPEFLRPFSVGANIKMACNRVKGEMDDSPSGSSFGAGIDLGFLWEVSEKIRYGLLFKDLPVISKWKNVSTGESYYQADAATLQMGGTFRAGYKTFLIAEGQIPLSKDQNWKMSGGIEQELFKYILFRAGMQKEIQTVIESPWKITGGLGVNVKRFSLDGSYEFNTLKVFNVLNISLRVRL